jgi:hypothetical protein
MRRTSLPIDVTETGGGIEGERVIAVLYVVVVAIAGTLGAAIGSIGLRDLEAVSFLGLVTFQPTPVGLAAFGMTTVGVALGVALLLVMYVSRTYVDA